MIPQIVPGRYFHGEKESADFRGESGRRGKVEALSIPDSMGFGLVFARA